MPPTRLAHDTGFSFTHPVVQLSHEQTTIVRTSEALQELTRALAGSSLPVGFDTETSGPSITWRKKSRPDPYRAKLSGFSISLGDSKWYVPVDHAEGVNVDDADIDDFLRRLMTLAIEGRRVWAHNWKYDLQILKNFGVDYGTFSRHLLDSMVAAWLAGWGADHASLKLKKLAEAQGLGSGDTFEDVAKKRQARDIPVEELAPYAGRDAWLTVQIGEKAWSRLEQHDLVKHFTEVDMPLVEILRGIEEWGTATDVAELEKMRTELVAEVEALADEFKELTTTTVLMPVNERVATGEQYKNGNPKMKTVEVQREFTLGANVSNDHQVARWCYEELKVWPLKIRKVKGGPISKIERTKAHHYPVGKEYLEKWTILPDALGARLAVLRLEHAWRTKLIGTYLDPMLRLPEQYADGYLHGSYHLTGTVTQRLSSSGPNLQNVPARTEHGKRLRRALIARPGRKIIVLDYSQIELRLAAHLSQDAGMLAAYLFEDDLHQLTLDAMRLVWPEAQRGDAKINNFCVAPATQILKSDLSWCRADEVSAGDELVGFDEGLGRHARYEKTCVEAVKYVRQPTYRVLTTRGVLECSATHAWVVREPRRWVETKDLRPGDKVAFLESPWERTADSWLSGMFDGEGSCSAQGQVGVAQNKGPTLDRLRAELDRHGIEYAESPSKSSNVVQLLMRNGSGIRAVGKLAPSRLVPKYQAHLFGSRCTNPHAEDVVVVSVEYLGEQILVGHQTTTHTLVSNGFLTHNSTIYRISPPSLAVKIRNTEEAAEKSIEAFYARYPGIGSYHRKAIAFAAKRGYAQCIDGFKRFLDVTPRKNRWSGKMEMSWGSANEAINTPIQGSAGAIAKRAMIDIHEHWVREGVYGDLVILAGQEHDSILAEAREDYADKALALMKLKMENAWELRVPLIADGGIGNSWAEAKGT